MKWVDAHCHLQDQQLFPDLGPVVERAAAAGVERMVCCGTNSGDWEKVLGLAEAVSDIGKANGGTLTLLPMIGIHPWFVSNDWTVSFQILEKTLSEFPRRQGAEPAPVGIGETGLDFCDRFKNREQQEAVFAAHLDLARELNRPVVVHCVQAWGRLLDILHAHPAPRILLHAFGGAPELIPQLIKKNCWFSFCGNVTNPHVRRVRASAAAVPEDRLLMETDAPDFPPAGTDKPNEPAHLIHTARCLAELRSIPLKRLAEVTGRNAASFFASKPGPF